jgi:HSP20 family protein
MLSGNRWGVLAAEIGVDDECVSVSPEIPGMRADEFEIDVQDDILVVRGEKHMESTGMRGRFHVMERAYGGFERALRLPASVDKDAASATYERGVLNISLPRLATAGNRQVKIKVN